MQILPGLVPQLRSLPATAWNIQRKPQAHALINPSKTEERAKLAKPPSNPNKQTNKADARISAEEQYHRSRSDLLWDPVLLRRNPQVLLGSCAKKKQQHSRRTAAATTLCPTSSLSSSSSSCSTTSSKPYCPPFTASLDSASDVIGLKERQSARQSPCPPACFSSSASSSSQN